MQLAPPFTALLSGRVVCNLETIDLFSPEMLQMRWGIFVREVVIFEGTASAQPSLPKESNGSVQGKHNLPEHSETPARQNTPESRPGMGTGHVQVALPPLGG